MKPNVPELLLVLYIFLPINDALIASVLLGQIQAIHTARRAEKKLDLDLENDTDQALRDFLVAFWFNPVNATAYAYLGLLRPHLTSINDDNDD